MKILRWATVIVFAAVLGLYCAFSIMENLNTDKTYPTITLPGDILEISIASDTSELLRDIEAFDEKDGDLTDKVIVESISQFISDNTCTVTYAVADNDCHVAKATRTVRYTDYAPPRFYLKKPLVFAVDEKVDIRDLVGAEDCIDGDISDRVTVIATDYLNTTAGVFNLSLQVSNSRGDMIYLDLPIYVEQNNKLAPKVALTESLIYIKKGETPAFEDYVRDVTINGTVVDNYKMLISSNLVSEKEGVYNIHYYVTDDNGYEGHSILTVIVEE